MGTIWKPAAVNGGARRDRTADLYNAIVALSQLSYGPDAFAARAYRSALRVSSNGARGTVIQDEMLNR